MSMSRKLKKKLIAAAAALTGKITDPRTLGVYPEITLPSEYKVDDSAVIMPASAADAPWRILLMIPPWPIPLPFRMERRQQAPAFHPYV